MKARTRLSLFLISVSALPIFADTLVLDNGRELEGVVVEETEKTVVFKLKTGSQITLPTSGIQNLIRSETSELWILEGDTFFDTGDFEKADAAYRKALGQGAQGAEERLAKLDRVLEERVESLLKGMDLEESEIRLRRELTTVMEDNPFRRIYRAHLSQVLAEKGKRALKNHSPEIARGFYAEAWALDPDNGDFGPDYLAALERSKTSQEDIIDFLTDYNRHHPDRTAFAWKLASRIQKERPCDAADLLAPAGIPLEASDTLSAQLRSEVFRECFHEDPFPENAMLARTEYYEIHLEIEPDSDRSPLYEVRIEEEPSDSNLYSEYANYLIESNRSEQAVEVYRRLLAIKPDSTQATDFLHQWESEREKMAFRDEVARIEALEKPYQLAGTLSAEDFPLIKDPAKIESMVVAAREVSAVLNNRPTEMTGPPTENALVSLMAYRTELESATLVAKAKDLLNQSTKVRRRAKVEDRAPEFTLSDLNGNTLSLSDYSEKVVLLYFWATWCPACRAEIPFVANVQAMFKDDDLRIVGINLDTDRSALTQFLQANPKVNWPQTFDGKGWETPAALVYGVESTPTTFLIDRNGIIRFDNPRGQDLINGIVQLLMEEPGEGRSTITIHGSIPPNAAIFR
jgi:thiol-disulfide isomerase/thioredoxin